MGVVDIGSSWSTGDQPTAAVLNAKWTSSTFNSSAVDDSSTALSGGAIIVKDGGIATAKIAATAVTAAKLATDAVETAKIKDANVTAAKLAATLDLSGNTLTFPAGGIVQGEVDAATQAEMEAESAAGICVPATLKNHPGVAKCFGVVSFDNSAPVVEGDYNVASVSEPSEGKRRITFTNPMSSAVYVVQLTLDYTDSDGEVWVDGRNASYFDIDTDHGDETNYDIHFVVYGTLA